MIKTIPKRKKWKKAKWLSEEALQIAEKRREKKGKGEKERYIHLNAEFQRITRRDKKASLSDQCGEGNGNQFQYSCLENPKDRRGWWAPVHGVTEESDINNNIGRGGISRRKPVNLHQNSLGVETGFQYF